MRRLGGNSFLSVCVASDKGRRLLPAFSLTSVLLRRRLCVLWEGKVVAALRAKDFTW